MAFMEEAKEDYKEATTGGEKARAPEPPAPVTQAAGQETPAAIYRSATWGTGAGGSGARAISPPSVASL